MKKLFAVILVLAMIFSMAACAEREQSDTAKTDTGTEQAETMLAYVPEELPCPERLGDIWSWDSWGDTIWLAGMNSDNTMYAASYDTINGHWQSYELDSGRTYNMCYMDISVSEDSLWILFRGYDLTEYVADPVNAELVNCVYTMDINSRQSSCAAIPFEAGEGQRAVWGILSPYWLLTQDELCSALKKKAI